MFDAIAPTYERVNRLASVGRDAYWRREMVRLAEVRPEDIMLDVACGTGDVVRAFAGAPIRPARILGLDFAPLMLGQAVGRPVLGGSFACGDALRLPVADSAVSLVTCAFGIRNFENLGTGLNEMHRVLMPGGRVVIIERLDDEGDLRELYRSMPEVLRRLKTWSHYILTSYPDFETLIGQEANRRRKLYNARIQCTYYQFHGPKRERADTGETPATPLATARTCRASLERVRPP